MITRENYLMGRDLEYPEEFTQEISANVGKTVVAINGVLADMEADGIAPDIDQITGTYVASGWRPRAINDRTSNAAETSTHIDAKGGDLQDHQDRRCAGWCLTDKGRASMKRHGVWMENPQWTSRRNPETKTRDPWVHWQTVPPRSGMRVFRPSMAEPAAPPLPGQTPAEIVPYNELNEVEE